MICFLREGKSCFFSGEFLSSEGDAESHLITTLLYVFEIYAHLSPHTERDLVYFLLHPSPLVESTAQ